MNNRENKRLNEQAKESESRALDKIDTELFSSRIKRIAGEVKANNKIIATLTDAYNKKYEKEIAEGTTTMQLLLEEGKKDGLTKEQVTVRSGFIPTIYTPRLNWLYFFMDEYKDHKIIGNEKEIKRNKLNEQFANKTYNEEKSESSKQIPDMYEYLYGNVTSEIFDKLKKLKAMSLSDNENEAFAAYRAGIRICKEYDLDFDKVPSPYKK